jgi:hypothetical protein
MLRLQAMETTAKTTSFFMMCDFENADSRRAAIAAQLGCFAYGIRPGRVKKCDCANAA